MNPETTEYDAKDLKAHTLYKSLQEGGIVCTQGECTMWLYYLDLTKPLVES
jgi:hypothetical protein